MAELLHFEAGGDKVGWVAIFTGPCNGRYCLVQSVMTLLELYTASAAQVQSPGIIQRHDHRQRFAASTTCVYNPRSWMLIKLFWSEQSMCAALEHCSVDTRGKDPHWHERNETLIILTLVCPLDYQRN